MTPFNPSYDAMVAMFAILAVASLLVIGGLLLVLWIMKKKGE